MTLNIVCLLFSIIISHSLSIDVNSCSNYQAILPNVTYSINSYVCNSSPCLCITGCPAEMSVDFVTPYYLENMKPRAHAYSLGVETDYPLWQNDACDGFTNTQCPIVKGEKVNYKYVLNIPSYFPEVPVTLQFSLVNKETDQDFVCFVLDLMVQKDDCPA